MRIDGTETHWLANAAVCAPWICGAVFLISSLFTENGDFSVVAIGAALGTALGPTLGIAALLALAVDKRGRQGRGRAAGGIVFGIVGFIICVGIIMLSRIGPAMKG